MICNPQPTISRSLRAPIRWSVPPVLVTNWAYSTDPPTQRSGAHDRIVVRVRLCILCIGKYRETGRLDLLEHRLAQQVDELRDEAALDHLLLCARALAVLD